MTDDLIPRLRALLAEGTPTPWTAEHGGKQGAWLGHDSRWAALSCGDTPDEATANAVLIVEAINALPGLLSEVERLQEELSEAVDLLNGVEIFVKSREQINNPTGHEWFDKRLSRAREALGQGREGT
jgi:hypothetical protein